MNNTITIVTPSLNQGQFIEQTIKSVLSQEGDFFIDYIIADGGSTDNSVEIIKKYDKLLKTKKYPIKCKGINCRWWSRPDKGQSNAINQGFKIAKGDILAYINSDDYYEPRALKVTLKKFKENPDIDLIYGDGYKVKDKTKKLKKTIPGTFNDFLRRKIYIFQPSAFFTKNIIQRVGLLDEDLHYAMDLDMWLKILKNGKALHISNILSSFRLWDDSKSTPINRKKILKERKKIFKKHKGNIIDPIKIDRIINNKISKQVRKKSFTLYKIYKNVIYFLSDKLHY